MSDTESTDVETLPDESDGIQEEQASKEVPSEETQDGDEESSEETAEETEEPSDDGEDAAEEVKPKKRRNVQKRISELTRARHTAEREAQQLRQQVEALQANVAPEAAPKQEDFQSIDEYVLASAQWTAKETVRKELENLGTTVQQNQQQAEQTARSADWEVKVEDARDKYDDFEEVVLAPENTFFTPTVFEALKDTENGTDLAYHLASNPKLGREIAALTPMRAVIRIGQLSAKLAEKPRPKQTAAPKPVKTVGGGRASPQRDPSKMSQKDFEAWMDKREKR